MRKLLALVCVLALTLLCTACAEDTIRIAALKGPTAMGMVGMMRDAEDGGTLADRGYTFTIAASADEVTPLIVRGELDIAAVPANLAAVLYANTDGAVRVLAINTLGVLYIVERGETVTSVEDLRGRTIYSAGSGSTPEYALRYILTANGLDPETDVNIEWKSEHAECLAALLADETAVAMLPQPFVTTALTKSEDMRVALDLNAEWSKTQEGLEDGSALITGVVIARSAFIEEQPEAVSRFLDDYAASVDFVLTDTEAAAALVGAYDIVTEEIARKALPACNITFIEGEEMRDLLNGYFEVLCSFEPKSVGGSVPDDAFYYIR